MKNCLWKPVSGEVISDTPFFLRNYEEPFGGSQHSTTSEGITQQSGVIAPETPERLDSSPGHPFEGGIAEQPAEDTKLHQQGTGSCSASFVVAVWRYPLLQVDL